MTIFDHNKSDVVTEYNSIQEQTRKDVGLPGIYVMFFPKVPIDHGQVPLIFGYCIYQEKGIWNIASTCHELINSEECSVKAIGDTIKITILLSSDWVFSDLYVSVYVSAFQPYYHIIG